MIGVKKQTSFPRERVKILLLEGIHPSAVKSFEDAGYQVELVKDALGEDELAERIKDVHLVGIRSKTQITPKVVEAAESLLGIGCFCIGTNQVALKEAAIQGIPVFNAPFSNTRSVAELVIAEIIMLARKASWRSQDMHTGKWKKSAKGSHEVRGKKLGIVGYGNIGPQVGLLGEALGMIVHYYDIAKKLPLGNAQQVGKLDQLLEMSDFVSLHVPETPETKDLIGKTELQKMKPGSYLLNLSRGSVVVIEDLCEVLKSDHLAGAAIDVFPDEPKSNDDPFSSDLTGLPNVILTPHIGGSTEEAQFAIGQEVSESLLKFLELGTTAGAVNFPGVELPYLEKYHRILNIHRNVPGVLSQINSMIAETGVNIAAQYLATDADIGYLIIDVGEELSHEVREKMQSIDANVKTRLLF